MPLTFDENFGLERASPVLANQAPLLCDALANALARHPLPPDANAWMSAQLRNLLTNPQHIHDVPFYRAIMGHAVALRATRHLDATLAWGRCAYLVSRRFASAWLPFLDTLIATGAVKSVTARAAADDATSQRYHGPVPMRIMQYWDKPVPPADVGRLIDGWKSRNKDFSHHVVDDHEARAFLLANFGQRTLTAYDHLTHVSSKSDVIRFAWTYLHGGIYVDADEVCERPVDALLHHETSLLLTWSIGNPPCVDTWFIACTPGEEFMRASLMLSISHIEEAARQNLRLNAWVLTGPGVLSMVLLDDWAAHGDLRVAANVRLMTEAEYRHVAGCAYDLEYRSTAAGNWRLENLSS